MAASLAHSSDAPIPQNPAPSNSLARSLSFLAVGALLILGGFFYQRLSDHLAAPDPPGPRVA